MYVVDPVLVLPILFELVTVVKLKQFLNIPDIVFTEVVCVVGKVIVLIDAHPSNAVRKVVVDAFTVAGSVTEVNKAQFANTLLKAVHALIVVGKVTEVKLEQSINALAIVVHEFITEGKVTEVKLKQLLKVEDKDVTPVIEVGRVKFLKDPQLLKAESIAVIEF
jgi:hypothetical protein